MTTTPSDSHADASPDSPVAAHVATALGRIPSGLFVITWREGEVDRVMLASWVMQAGFNPPLVSVAVGTARGFMAVARAGTPFAINVLAESQRPLLARFGKPIPEGDDPFAGIIIDRTDAGAAAFRDAAAWLACRTVGECRIEAADHVVVLARVEVAGGSADIAPVVHIRRNGLRY